MATYTYAPEKGDAVSRVRRDLGDRDMTAAKWSDEEILSVLRETATTDFLSFELPSDTTIELQDVAHDLVGGTVEIRVGDEAVELLLRRILHGGTAQEGDAISLTLAAGASTTTDAYLGYVLRITAGAGEGQERTVTAYNGTTKIALVVAWDTAPDDTSVYQVLDVDTFPLSTGIDYDKVTDVIDAVRVLDKGWSVLLASRAEGEIINFDWPIDRLPSEPMRRVAYGRATADLMLTGEINVFGAPKRLSLYNVPAALTRLRFMGATDTNEPESITDGDVTITRVSAKDALEATAAPMGIGVHRTIF